MRLLKTLPFAVGCLSGASLLAQSPGDTTISLREVVVTANKFPQKQTQTGKVITVLSDSLLRRNAGKTLTDVLNQQVGLTIIGSQNSPGTNQDVYMRGAGSGNTLILIDGIPVYDPSGTSNNFDLNLFALDQIERVEILKGAQSTLYGSDAVAGVINIITRKGATRKASPSVTLAGGTYGTFRGSVGVGGGVGKFHYNAQYTKYSSAGFSSAYDSTGKQNFDKDGINQDVARLSLGYRLAPQLLVKAFGQYSGYKTGLDAGAFVDERDYNATNRNWMGGTGLEYQYGAGKLYLNYVYNSTRRSFLHDSTYAPVNGEKYSQGQYNGTTQYLEAYTNVQVNPYLELVGGIDYRFANTGQTYLSVTEYGLYQSPPIHSDTAKASQWSGYASALLKNAGGLNAELGGRLNHHSIYGNNYTFSFNPSYLAGEWLKLFANASSGFKAPTLYELWSPYGNRNLRPETSISYEGGWEIFSRNKKSNFRVVYFDRQINNVIVFESTNTAPYGRYINFDKQRDHGLEVEGNVQAGKFNFTANYTYVNGHVSTRTEGGADTTYFNLYRRPKHTGNLNLGFQATKALLLSAHLRAVGQRTDLYYNSNTFATEPVKLGGYATIDLYGEYKLNKQLRVFLDLRNLTNRQFFDLYGYNSRRFNFMAGVSLSL